MPQIIAFTSPKGGCGATFVCASLWRTLKEKSHSVLALDMCFDRCTLDFALGFQDDYIYTLSDVINGDCTLQEAVCSGGGDFIRADYEKEFFDYSAAAEIIRNGNYDYVLIDVSSADKQSVQEITGFADKLILVTDCAPISARLCQAFADSIEASCDVFVIINKINPYYIRDGIHLTADEVLDSAGCLPLGLIPWDCYAEFIIGNSDDSIYNLSALKPCFDNIAKRLAGDRVPACDIEAMFKDGRTYKYLTRGRK